MPIYHTLPRTNRLLSGKVSPETGAQLWYSRPWDEPAIFIAMLFDGRFGKDAEFASRSAATFAARLAVQLAGVENAAS